jgi:hypothetical protein
MFSWCCNMFTLGFIADSNGRYQSPTSTLCRAWKTNSQRGNSALDLIRIDVFVGSLSAKSWILVVEVSESLSELVKKNLCKIERPTWNPNKSVETLCFQWTGHFQVTCPIRWKTGGDKKTCLCLVISHS